MMKCLIRYRERNRSSKNALLKKWNILLCFLKMSGKKREIDNNADLIIFLSSKESYKVKLLEKGIL